MKTKVTSDNNTEVVPAETTGETTSAAQSSVWSICDISTDSHVELRDITPSISPVFTDDQVHELTRNSTEVDVLGEHFLPPDTFKRIDEVLSSGGQANLLYTDPVLGNALKQNHDHDVLLPGDLSFHGSMFPSFDSIVEADRILNKRDGPSDLSSSEVADAKVGVLDSVDWSDDGTSAMKPTEGEAVGDDESSGINSKLRRSPRKRVQVKKDTELLKTITPSQKSVSRGKDISKLKYANTKDEVPEKEVRRSSRAQKNAENQESNADEKEKDTNVNSKKKNSKKDEGTEKEPPGSQDSTSKTNVRRSPRNQSRAPLKEEKKVQKRRDENKETSTEHDNNRPVHTEPVDKENKVMTCEKADEKGTDDGKTDQDEKRGMRKSERITRNKEKQLKDEEGEKPDSKGRKGKEKQNNEKLEGKKVVKGNVKGDIEMPSDVRSKDNNVKNTSAKTGEDKHQNSDDVTKTMGNDDEIKALGRSTIEMSEDEGAVTTKRRIRKGDRKEEAGVQGNEAEMTKKPEAGSAGEGKDISATKRDPASAKEDKNLVKNEVVNKVAEAAGTESAVKEEKDVEKSSKSEEKMSSKDNKHSQEDEDSEVDSLDGQEEFNEDSDYDPEYDPDRLWCVCRKPHGNRFMICCDHCEEWFHGMCVGITMAQGRQMEKNGQEYICPKCKAKIEEEEESKETKPGMDITAKESQETSSSAKPGETEGRKSPVKRERHSRKEHSLKIKLPSPTETRKRRHSSRRKSRDENVEESISKRPKEFDKLFARECTKEEKKIKVPESKGFKIPKKVRTTPTPASYVPRPTHQKCITAGCTMLADRHSLYCSPECIHRHAEESLKIILEEKKKRMGYKSSVSSSKGVTSPTSSLMGPAAWDPHLAPGSSQSDSIQPKEGIAVIERSTGRVVAGVAAPSQEELVYWLEDHPTFEVLLPTVVKNEKKKEKKEDSEKAVRENIRKSLKEILTTRSKDQQDLNVTDEDIDKCSHNVEGEMFSFFGDTGHRYKNKYRSLMFNLKDPRNKVLFRHVLSGEIPVDRLVRMTPEQLASPELATWREQETKHTLEMIKLNQEEINATKAHIKKTHKGEVEIDDDDLSTLENSIKANAELNVEKGLPDSNTSSSTLLLDTTDEHRIHLFDLNCRICTGKMAPPGEPPRRETPSPLVSTTSIVQAVAESSMPSPTPMEIVTSANSPDSASVSQPPVSPSALSKTPKKVPAVWKGFVMMQSVAKFGTSAYRVSGCCDDLLHLLPDTLHVQGRIAHEQVWDYLIQLKSSTSREVCVIRYEASSDDEKLSYVSLYSYFYSRKRCGVVSNCYTGVKDMYLVPLASHQPIPPELLPFDGPGLDEPRPHMLLGVIVRSKAVFKRPRALSQRSVSPPPKRRISSTSVETTSSDGGTVDSPASKRDTLSELRDSPPADIDDIVFQYNTSQAKMADKESKDLSVKASPASEPSTSSMASSTGAVASPTVSADKSSVPSLEAQKKQLLDLQERARQYILAQTQRKGIAQEEAAEGRGQKIPGKCDSTNVVQEGGESEVNDDDDAPYDPEEGLDLDLSITAPSPAKPVVASKPVEPSKPSSLEVLVSTLQRLQGSAPNLSALSNILPQVATATSSVVSTQPNPNSGTTTSTAASLSSVEIRPTTFTSYGPQSSASASSILQPIIEGSRGFQSAASTDTASQQTVSTIHESQPSSAAHLQPKPLGSTEHLSQSGVRSGDSSHHAISSTQRPQLSPSADQRLRLGLSSAQRLQPQGSSDQSRHFGSPSDHAPHPAPSSDHRAQRRSFSDHRLQSETYSDRRSQVGPPDRRRELGPSSDLASRPSADQRLQPGSASVQGHPSGPSGSPHTNRWNPSEPPQVTRQVNNINQDVQKYGDLRPEDRARLAAHESRLESRENRRSSSDHRDEHCEQRGMDDMHRSGWHNDPRFPRDSRNPRDDSRRNWRDEYRRGRPWYGNGQRQDRYENQIDGRPRHEDRRQERRFKEPWSRDRWRR